eukprot:COSAG04_NODE_34187_length_115_cov_1845.750000_1_plen_28_part_01
MGALETELASVREDHASALVSADERHTE